MNSLNDRLSAVAFTAFQAEPMRLPRVTLTTIAAAAVIVAIQLSVGAPDIRASDVFNVDICSESCNGPGPFPYVKAREVYLRYAPGSSAVDYATVADDYTNISFPGYIEVVNVNSAATGIGTYACVSIARSAERTYQSAWIDAKCMCCDSGQDCEHHLPSVAEHSLGGTLTFPPSDDCFDGRINPRGSVDNRPKQKPCRVTNPDGAKLKVAPNGNAEPVVAVDPFGFYTVPVVVPYGRHVGWETGPGPAFVKRHAVNHYRWVTNIYRRNRHPTRRGWVSVDDLDCTASARARPSADPRFADFVTIGVYDLPSSIDTGILEHLIEEHGLDANFEVFSPSAFQTLTAEELTDVDLWLVGSSEDAAPIGFPCTTSATPCVTSADYDGFRNNIAFQAGALTGRRVFTGQDPDDHALRHTTPGHGPSARLLINAIEWAALGSGTGFVALVDTVANFDWTPPSWGVQGTLAASGSGAVGIDISEFTHPLNYRLPREGYSFQGVVHRLFTGDVAGYETITFDPETLRPVTIAAPPRQP